MKEFIKKNIVIIIIIIAITIIFAGVLSLIISQNKNNSSNSEKYKLKETVKEMPGTKRYTTEQLRSSHCLEKICITDATFYYVDDKGRVEYTITNNSDDVVSGYLKMVFENQSLVIAYNSVNPHQTVKTASYYQNVVFDNKSDYVLQPLDKKDLENIVKS